MQTRYHTLLAVGVVSTALAVMLSLRAPKVEVATSHEPLPVAAATSQSPSALADAPPALRERLLHSLLRAAQRAAANATDSGLNQLHWRESEWLADPAAGLERLRLQCERSLGHAFSAQQAEAPTEAPTEGHNGQDIQADIRQLCDQQLRLSLAHQFGLSSEQASQFIAISRANPQPLNGFQARSPLSDFAQPLAFFDAYWAEQDALYGAEVAAKVFGPQRDGMRFNQRFQDFLSNAGTLPLSERLSWYQRQQNAFSQRHGQPLSALSSDASEDLNRLIALHELDPSDDPVQRRYELRRTVLGEDKASRWRTREQRQWQTDGQLARLYAAE
ncbi:hypothetical protein ACQUQU_11810 [Thalassolituus sp. LLYu03]|uniref:hypothetical protein n=1 Tax=Thalassolituus sp. LLYu03 TaxID=3421656 RepID=UPI003D2AEADD